MQTLVREILQFRYTYKTWCGELVINPRPQHRTPTAGASCRVASVIVSGTHDMLCFSKKTFDMWLALEYVTYWCLLCSKVRVYLTTKGLISVSAKLQKWGLTQALVLTRAYKRKIQIKQINCSDTCYEVKTLREAGWTGRTNCQKNTLIWWGLLQTQNMCTNHWASKIEGTKAFYVILR